MSEGKQNASSRNFEFVDAHVSVESESDVEDNLQCQLQERSRQEDKRNS